MKNQLLLFGLILFLLSGKSQDTIYTRTIVDSLCSINMFGRGYVKKGDVKAANFIKKEFEKNGTTSFSDGYLQPVSFSVNTFPSSMEVIINDSILKPFYDYRISPSSSGCKGTFQIVEFDAAKLSKTKKINQFSEKNDLSNSFVYIDLTKLSEKKQKSKSFSKISDVIYYLGHENVFNAKGVIIVSDKLDATGIWAGSLPINTTVIKIQKSSVKNPPKTITVNIENEFVQKYKSNNVIAFIEGNIEPDTFIVFTAHYDHIGSMGANTFFPGANDNASGIATILDLAKYYSSPENKPYYSIAFMAFTGEEAGILGSYYYTNHPLFPLKNIKLLFNLDMVGTGENGITVVNGTVYEKAYNHLVSINNQEKYLTKVVSRGEAANSDHHYFHKSGVPSVFIYGMGKSGPYHHPEDNSANLTFKGYIPIFKLLTNFVKTYR